jgi:basic membrane protein A
MFQSMKKTRKIFLTALLFLMTACIALTGCESRIEEWKPGRPIKAEEIKIGILYLADPFNATSGFTYEHHEGVKAMQKTLGLRDNQMIIRVNVRETEQAAIEHSIREMIMLGAQVIFAVNAAYAPVCEKLSAEYPKVVFAVVAGYTHNSANFTNYYGKIHQARYLSGIVAGLRTKTDKVGFVAAMGRENSQVSSGLNAFALGVESVNPRAQVYVRVVHNWFDPAAEALTARLLTEDGCDVIAQHTDTASPLTEARKAGVWAIGYNSDMRREAPEAVITSVVWHWDVYYTYLVKSVLDGSFTTAPYFGGIAEGLVGLSPLNEELAAPGTAAAVAAVARRMKDDNFEVYEGVLETNDGRRMGTAGGTFSDLAITRDITWYYRNIVTR